ncbi:hypothetical protein HYQ45_008541 [Verticillium longisporum]|uniref:Uncharacterized protein n=1 Tax=Verticillium longisporum TaxID=100787 RepID=A0A8I2ZN80_VERLO|nr:hypothetical protein HYQ45_008541 [Verticillium longisporum]
MFANRLDNSHNVCGGPGKAELTAGMAKASRAVCNFKHATLRVTKPRDTEETWLWERALSCGQPIRVQ